MRSRVLGRSGHGRTFDRTGVAARGNTGGGEEDDQPGPRQRIAQSRGQMETHLKSARPSSCVQPWKKSC